MMVEVAGIEPASKEQLMSESTCLVVFDRGQGGGRQSDPPRPGPMVLAGYYGLWYPEQPHCFDAQSIPGGTGRLNVSSLCCC